MSDWMPIESAPRDKTIIITNGRTVITARFQEDPGWDWKGSIPCWAHFMCDDDYYSQYEEITWATHWMPLPQPPEVTK
jgi:hypothetical protein